MSYGLRRTCQRVTLAVIAAAALCALPRSSSADEVLPCRDLFRPNLTVKEEERCGARTRPRLRGADGASELLNRGIRHAEAGRHEQALEALRARLADAVRGWESYGVNDKAPVKPKLVGERFLIPLLDAARENFWLRHRQFSQIQPPQETPQLLRTVGLSFEYHGRGNHTGAEYFPLARVRLTRKFEVDALRDGFHHGFESRQF